MIRVLLAAVLLGTLPPIVRAGETVVRLSVRPMVAPKPALKYLLLPEVRELNPGNPAQWYVRCFAEQRNFFYNKEFAAERARYRSMPLAELRALKVRSYSRGPLNQVDWGARLDALDWQVTQRVQTEGTGLLLSELEPLRVLAGTLQTRLRIEVADGRFDDAARSVKTMFALARHLGEHPVAAANRIGLETANLAVDTLQEMVQQPGCPNLYWALTDLPRPLMDVRQGLQGHRALVAADLRRLRDDSPMTDEEIEKVVSRLSGVMGFAREQAGRPPRSLRAVLAARVKNLEEVNVLRARMIEAENAEEMARKFLRIGSFPALQVILLDEKHAYEVRGDEDMKLLGLAPWQIDALAASERRGRGAEGLFADLLPRVVGVRRAQARLQQRLALLRHVEALRFYAAAHEGKLPDKLSECLPLPLDPFIGKPFVYKVEAATAYLRGGSPRGEETNPSFNIRYEITLRK